MKKFLLILIMLMIGMGVFAVESDEALNFFSGFVSASNNYSSSVLDMYSDKARIIRQVVKPDGQTVNAYFSMRDYEKQMKISAKLAKIKNYKNSYSNIRVVKLSNGYRIDSLRTPSGTNYKLKASTTIQKQTNGKWLIVEELMQTKEQIFLKYAK